MIWAYNLEKLIKLFSIRDREKALCGTDRFEEFEYEDNHIDGPSPRETELEQMRADELHYTHLERFHRINDLLSGSESAESDAKKAIWLHNKLGYEGVCIKGYSKPVSFSRAITAGYGENISGMFKTEVNRLTKLRDESSRYIFLKPRSN